MAAESTVIQQRAPRPDAVYQSRFGKSEARASVRTKPLRILDEHRDGKVFFPADLVPGPLDRDTLRGVIEESHPPAEVQATVRRAAAATLSMFHRNGVFDDPRTRDCFARHGLVDA